MFRFFLLLALVLPAPSMAEAAPLPNEVAASTGILVFDNCGGGNNDNLTLLDSAGRQTFRESGFDNCESIGNNRMIAADPYCEGTT